MKDFQVNPEFRFIFVHLTNRCNLNCKHCYVSSSPDGTFGLSNSVVKQIIGITSDLKNKPQFILSGGEPLSRKKDCLDILEYAVPVLKTKLFTNGILISKEIAIELTKLQPEIRISMDGSTRSVNDAIRGEGTFDKIIKGIKNLLNAGYPAEKLSLCATIPEFDSIIIKGFIDIANTIGVHTIRFNALCRRGRGADLASALYGTEQQRDIIYNKHEFDSCFNDIEDSNLLIGNLDKKTSLFSTLNIYDDGSVYPYIPHDHLNPRNYEICAGNVNKTRLDQILISQAMKESVLKKFLNYSISVNKYSRAFAVELIENERVK